MNVLIKLFPLSTEKSPGMFATVVIVLPSEFSGGSLHLSHAGKTQIIDVASGSLTMTHALAWYTDVYHSVHPVLSGYRLALSYNLVHAKAYKPSLHDISKKADILRHIMFSWKEAKEGKLKLEFNIPDRLCYLLDHEYSKVNLLAGALKGADARLIAQLAPIAEELDFGLFISNIELSRSGTANDEGEHDGSEGSVNVSDLEFESDVLDELDILNSVDSNGMPMAASQVQISKEDVVPEGFGRGRPTRKEYGGYMGNVPFLV